MNIDKLSANLIIQKTQSQGSIYLGSILSASNEDMLLTNNINAVISVVGYKNIIKLQRLNHLVLFTDDNEDQNITKYFDQSFEFIQKHRKTSNILIHCIAGVSRSATILIAYLMKSLRIRYNEAYKLVKSKRQMIQPNPGFHEQLIHYQKILFSQL